MTPPIATQVSRSVCDNGQHIVRIENQVFHCSNKNTDNDPSAGSPTETLCSSLVIFPAEHGHHEDGYVGLSEDLTKTSNR
ncbi:hypothetical protein DERF_006166 [Dermatophagoides farinae]|uniref:Uncharacterized protein n=1 Tax=Dermatophagoides farinae TaxID=6954 RepID=A0A922I5Q7_DERFA|nr:hypothetical protein DERF_006166 [Dermatophagoides farinae]